MKNNYCLNYDDNAIIKKELDKKEKLDAEKRKKASSVSKTKPTTVEKKPKFDPLALSGDDFRNYFDGIGRG